MSSTPPKKTPPKKKKPTSGRVTPKGTTPGSPTRRRTESEGSEAHAGVSSRYTPPDLHTERITAPWVVPVMPAISLHRTSSPPSVSMVTGMNERTSKSVST